MKIAVISTIWYPLSHTDVIVARWEEPYWTDADKGWTKPASTIASVYLDQTTDRDIGHAFCRKRGIPIFDSVRSALTLGTETLAVDAVLLIAEHGDYPHNEFRQKLYPRKELFDAIAAVFRESGRVVPVFNDKHLSWDFDLSCQMLAMAEELGFPLYAGSSLTHCPLDPGLPLTPGEGVTEALALFHGDPDNYGFHTMEYVQSLVERRPGGEPGIRALRALEGPAVQAAVAAGEVPRDLLLAALVRHGYPDEDGVIPFILERAEGCLLYQLEHRDGLKVYHLALPKFVSRWIAAVRAGDGTVRSCAVVAGGAQGFFANFAWLNGRVNEFFQTGRAPTPLKRTHLITGALQAVLQALPEKGRRIETSHLAVTY